MSKFDMSIQEKLLSAPASMVAVTILVVNTAPRLDIMAEHMETQTLSVIFNRKGFMPRSFKYQVPVIKMLTGGEFWA